MLLLGNCLHFLITQFIINVTNSTESGKRLKLRTLSDGK